MYNDESSLGHILNEYGLWTWVWVVFLSLSGGVANFFRKLKEGNARAFNFAEFIGELFISAFSGIVTFLMCESAGFTPIWSAALIAISGHMGSRAIFLMEKLFASKFESISPYPQVAGNRPPKRSHQSNVDKEKLS